MDAIGEPASCFHDELASTVEHAVQAAVDTVLREISRVVGGRLARCRREMAGKEKEIASLRLRLEISQGELEAVRRCVSAADANIKRALGSVSAGCKGRDRPGIESRRVFSSVQDTREGHTSLELESEPKAESSYPPQEVLHGEWGAAQMPAADGTCVESSELSEENLELECILVKEEATEVEYISITGEVSTESDFREFQDSGLCNGGPPELVCVKPSQRGSEDTCSSVGEEGTVLGSIPRKHHTPQERAAGGKEEGAAASSSSAAYDPEKDSMISSCGRGHRHSLAQRRPAYLPSWISEPENPLLSHSETLSSVPGPGVCQLTPAQAGQLDHQGEPPFALGEFERGFQRFDSQLAGRAGRWGRGGDSSPPGEGGTAPAGGSSAYHCPECGKSFTNLRNLKTHQLIHSGEKPYQCGQCGKSFRQMGAVRKHQRIHTGEKPYQCTECGKSFNELGNLRKHQRIHAGVKPYRCPVCGRGFVQSEHLKKHRRTHAGEKPHRCPQCWQGFADPHSLRTHQCGLMSA